MASEDPELATKAPESDLEASDPLAQPQEQKPSIISSKDTLAQDDATMDHCTTDRPTPSGASPKGEINELGGVQCYVTKPAEYPHNPGRLLLLLTGGTGLHSTNNQLQADEFAQRGFLVVMPDQFGGDPAPNASTSPPSQTDKSAGPSILERIKLGVAETSKAFMLDMWLAKHTPERVLPLVRQALEGAKEQFADAVANGNGVYGAGYCFGAKYILLLLGTHASSVLAGQKSPGADVEAGEVMVSPELKAGAIAHGTMVTKADLEAVRRPISMVCVKDDPLFPEDIREQGRAALELESIAHEVKTFEGVPHGFAVVGDFENHPEIGEKQKEAFEMMASWLEKH